MKRLALLVVLALALGGGGFAWWKFKLPPFKSAKKSVAAKTHDAADAGGGSGKGHVEPGTTAEAPLSAGEVSAASGAAASHGDSRGTSESRAGQAPSASKPATPTRDQRSVQRLATVYEGLPAQRAADLMSGLPKDLAIELMRGMDEQKAGKILLSMDPKLAARMTVALSLASPEAAGTGDSGR
jgi:hypothetical protein